MSCSSGLYLESGEFFEADFLGETEAVGEVVFNTSHSGYEQISSDPSYYSQILVLTAPQQGNYNLNKDFLQSKKFWIKAFVCLDLSVSPSFLVWKEALLKSKIPILNGLDTRSLTLHLRDKGTLVGVCLKKYDKKRAQNLISEFKKTQSEDWTLKVSVSKKSVFKGQNPKGPKFLLLDFGFKQAILDELLKRSSEVTVLPSSSSFDEIQALNPDAICLSNGPGDPEKVQAYDLVKKLVGFKPIFGICMGHQVLCRALGAQTFKMKFGHRGSNHPVKDHLLNKVYITAQNHGYAVCADTLPSFLKISHTHLNDKSVAGVFCKSKSLFSVQFHPESEPGPQDAKNLFDFFIKEFLC